MTHNDPLKQALDLWQVNPPLDTSLAVKVREAADERKEIADYLFGSDPSIIISNERRYALPTHIQTFAFWQRRWSFAVLSLSALVLFSAGVMGGVLGQQQKASQTQTMVALYLSKINPL